MTYLNPYRFPIAIATGTTGCPSRHLMTNQQPGVPVRIHSGSSVASTVAVGMDKAAPDGCQGARFRVRVFVTAVEQ